MNTNLSTEDREYILNHLPIHLIRAGETEDLRSLMKDQVFLEEALNFGVDWLSHPEVKAVIGIGEDEQ